jgi:hypothetical protein
MVLQSRLLILFKPKINFYPFNGLKLLLYCVLSKNYSKLSHKSSENWYCSSLAYLQEIVLALKGFRQNKHCLGHRSKIKYWIRLSQYRKSNRFSKILKNRFITPNYHEIIYNYLQKLMLKISQNAISAYCAYLKGGHHPEKNWYFIYKKIIPFYPKSSRQNRLCFIVCYCF